MAATLVDNTSAAQTLAERTVQAFMGALRLVANWFMTQNMYRATSAHGGAQSEAENARQQKQYNWYSRNAAAKEKSYIEQPDVADRNEKSSFLQRSSEAWQDWQIQLLDPDFWVNQAGRNVRAALCWLLLGTAIAVAVVLTLSPAAPAGVAIGAATWQAVLIGSAASFSLGIPLWLDALYTNAKSGADCVGYGLKLLLSSILMSPMIILLLPHSAAVTLSGWLGLKTAIIPSLGAYFSTCAVAAAVSALYQAGMHLLSSVMLFCVGAPNGVDQRYSAKQRLLMLAAKGMALFTPFAVSGALFSLATQFAWLPHAASAFFCQMSTFEAFALCSAAAAVPATALAVLSIPVAVVMDGRATKEKRLKFVNEMYQRLDRSVHALPGMKWLMTSMAQLDIESLRSGGAREDDIQLCQQLVMACSDHKLRRTSVNRIPNSGESQFCAAGLLLRCLFASYRDIAEAKKFLEDEAGLKDLSTIMEFFVACQQNGRPTRLVSFINRNQSRSDQKEVWQQIVKAQGDVSTVKIS